MLRTPSGLDPRHQQSQAFLRTIGPFVLGLGIVLTAIGMISFFSSFGTFEPPRYFWAVIVGLPLIGIGLGLTRLGYLGAIYRYFSGEMTPVARDTFNIMAEGTHPGVETMAHAMGRGLATGMGGNVLAELETLSCGHCQAPNPANARFCNQCGTALAVRTCAACGATRAPGARFCNQCGKPVE